jgi:hypothetical protein
MSLFINIIFIIKEVNFVTPHVMPSATRDLLAVALYLRKYIFNEYRLKTQRTVLFKRFSRSREIPRCSRDDRSGYLKVVRYVY